MVGQTNRVKMFLDTEGIPYTCMRHQQEYTAEQAAADTFTPPDEFAKTVVLETAGGYLLAVVPADRMVDLDAVRRLLGDRHVHLSQESRLRELFPDCEVGAEPPFGNLYDMLVYVSPALAAHDEITFNAGTHEEVIRMRYRDYERLVCPRLADIAMPHGG